MLPYRYMNHTELVQLVRSAAASGASSADAGEGGRREFVVVDCRDEDFRGGNIPGAIRAPSELRTDESVRALVEQLKDVPNVVFHCSLSQVRGPKTARIYAEAADAARSPSSAAAPSQPATPAAPSAPTQTSAEAARTFSPTPYEPAGQEDGKQQVWVLRDGFHGWQGLYRNDPILVENWDAGVWQDYSP
ncbi:hypothetical protein JCM10207_005465 [Rhodosporidiobolus poonsookiae]